MLPLPLSYSFQLPPFLLPMTHENMSVSAAFSVIDVQDELSLARESRPENSLVQALNPTKGLHRSKPNILICIQKPIGNTCRALRTSMISF